MRYGWRMCLLLLAWLPALAGAVIETYEFEEEDLRLRYQVLVEELRCPKCQNQNIADSNAPIAQDLRKQLHTQLHAGRSDDEIVDYMVQRYGEFVLYRPRWGVDTAVLWLAPVIFLALALLVLRSVLAGGGAKESGELDDEERRRLRSLVEDGSPRD